MIAVYRFTVGCIRPLCHPATENTKGQRFLLSGYGLLAFFFNVLLIIIKKEYRVKREMCCRYNFFVIMS